MHIRKVVGLGVASVILGLSSQSTAELRYRVDGNACLPSSQATVYFPAATGLRLLESSTSPGADRANCPIPLGPDLVMLDQSHSHALRTINIRTRQITGSADNTAYLSVHDYDSGDFCFCGGATDSTNAGQNGFLGMTFSCGTCSIANDWGANVTYERRGNGESLLTLISVYD